MQPSKRALGTVLFLLGLTAAVLCSLPYVRAQDGANSASAAAPAAAGATNAAAAPAGGTNAASTNAPAGSSTNTDSTTNAPPEEPKKLPTDLIPLSFQNMQIDQVVQWLSDNTGKSVVKHPSAHCQVTIVSTKKVTRQEAVTMVYRALGMEGFNAIESSDSILIVPDDKEPKLSPELLGATNTSAPGGRQRMIKVYPLQHVQAADLSDKVKTVLSKDAVVVTDDRANLMIITDYNDNLSAATSLIAALDVAKNEDVLVRVIKLQSVNAQDLAKQIKPLYDKLTSKQPKEIIEVSASDTANTLMVLSSQANFGEIEQFAKSLDTTNAQQRVMRTFDLKNADAQDVTKQLQDLGKDKDNSDSPYRIFYFGDNPNENTKTKISFVADRRRNAIVVQAPPSAMDEIARTITALDAPITDNNLAPKIVPLENVSAGDIEDVLNELFLKKNTQRSYYDYIFGNGESQDTRDVGRLYGKVRITSEAAANAIIITANSQENLDAVLSIVKELDKPSQAGDTTFHFKLNFGNAQKIANRINILFAKNGSQPLRPVNQPNQNNPQPPQPQQPNQQGAPAGDDFSLEQVVKEDPYYSWLGGSPDAGGRGGGGNSSSTTERPVSDLVGRVRVVPDEATSSLLVTANIHLFPQVSKMIEQMDVPPPQVLIDAKLVQVSANYLDNMGVRFSPDGSQVFSGSDFQNSFLPHAGGTYLKGFGNNTQVNNPITAGSSPSFTTGGGGSSSLGTISQALTSMRSGVLDSTLSMDFLIQFLHQKADATVIAEPQLTIADNDMGKLFVGKAVPIQTGNVSSGLTGTTTAFGYRNVGVIIEVEPHINESNDVALRIRAESSTVDPVQINNQPVFNAAQYRTELTAKAGQTLVMGGIIQKTFNDNVYKTPILGSIPGLNYIFGKRDKNGTRTELLVFLRPKVVRSPEQAKEMYDEVTKRLPLVEKSEQDQETKPEKELK